VTQSAWYTGYISEVESHCGWLQVSSEPIRPAPCVRYHQPTEPPEVTGCESCTQSSPPRFCSISSRRTMQDPAVPTKLRCPNQLYCVLAESSKTPSPPLCGLRHNLEPSTMQHRREPSQLSESGPHRIPRDRPSLHYYDTSGPQ